MHFGTSYSTNVNVTQEMQNFVQPCGPWNLNMMPWELATLSAPQPGGVMQFGDNVQGYSHVINGLPTATKPICKRKSAQECTLPPKQLITEERITAHFSGLHISNDYKQHHANGSGIAGGRVCVGTQIQGGLPNDDIPSTSTGKTDNANPAYEIAAQALKDKLRNAQRIVLCDQAKLLTNDNENTIIPEVLLKTMPRPCTALIPWQPPPFQANKMLMNVHEQKKSMEDEEDGDCCDVDVDIDDYVDNNNTCVMNFNKADNHMDEDI